MQYIKLFEDFKFSKQDSNIYALMGQNLQNYMTLKKQELLKNRYISQNWLKDLEELIKTERAKTLNVSDVMKLVNTFFTNLLKIANETDADLKALNDLHYRFMSYLTIAFRFDFDKVNKMQLHNDKWFNIYKITTIKELKEQYLLFEKRYNTWTNDKSKTKNLLITDLNTDYKNWQNFFKDEKILKYRDLKKYTIKPDEQQQEAENNINNFNAKMSNDDLQDLEKANSSEIPKIEKLNEISGFSEDFLKRFDQRGLPNSHRMMKPWFFAAFENAEKAFGHKLTITSGIRTEEYQKYLTSKGYQTAKKNSPHIAGVAADISIIGLDVNKLIQAFESAGFTRFGVGKSFLHVDLGDQLNPKIWVPYARWTYNY